MTLATNIANAFTRVGTEFKAVRTLIGGSGTAGISALTTTDKSSLVAAINETKAGNASSPPDASTTTKGIIEIATLAEVTTGTDTTRAVTPQGVKQEIDLVKVDGKLAKASNLSDLADIPTARGNLGLGSAATTAASAYDAAGTAADAQAAAISAAASDATTKADAKVADAINDGVTTVAPSQNAVFDALALKVPTSRTLAGVDLADDVTGAELRAALGIEWALLADETLASDAASWTGPTGLGSYDEIRLVVTGRTTQGSSTGAVNLRFNGNSTSGDYINGNGGSSTWLPIGSIAGSLTNTNRWGRVEAIIQNKAGTLHTVSSQYATTEANTNPPNSSHVVSAAGHFKQTAAITSLVVYPNTSTGFVAGTRFRVFGRLP